jgi:hypothetical protein
MGDWKKGGFDGGGLGVNNPLEGSGGRKGNKEIPGSKIEKKELQFGTKIGQGDNQASTPFGNPVIGPSLLYCDACKKNHLSQEIKWENGEAKCPICGGPIK